MRLKTLLLALLIGLASITSAFARTSVIVLPPDYAGAKPELVQHLGKTIIALKPPDRLLVFTAQGPTQLASIEVPDDPKAQNPAWVKRKLGEQAAAVIRYLDTMPPLPPNGHLAANLHIPDVLDDLGRNWIPSLDDKQADILLIGAWLYFDRRDGKFSVTDRFYPSDGHFLAPVSETPFGLAGHSGRLAGATVHLCWPGGEEAFVSEAYEQALRRVWSLWITQQGGRVGTLSFDLATCFARFRAGEASGQTVYQASGDPKVEMLRVPAPMPSALPPSFDRPGEYFLRDDVPISRTPPATTTGIAWIGLKWSAPCDVDLYARPDGTSQWLFYRQPRSADGNFNKDFLSATGERQFEFIEFVRPIDLAKAEVAINLFSGQLPTAPEGVIRVWFGAQVYEAPFKLRATQGNGGALPMSGAHWLRVDLRKVVGIEK